MLELEGDVDDYNRVVDKFKNKTLLEQLAFCGKGDTARTETNATAATLYKQLGLESSMECISQHVHSAKEQAALRNKSYMAFVESPEVAKKCRILKLRKKCSAS